MSIQEGFVLVDPSGGVGTFRIGSSEYPALLNMNEEYLAIWNTLCRMGSPNICICGNLGLEAYSLRAYLLCKKYCGNIGYCYWTINGFILVYIRAKSQVVVA